MAKINNIVRLVHFTSENNLYYQIDKEMNTDGEDGGDTRCYRIKDINLIDEHNALVYLEEDLSVVKVHFFDVTGAEVEFDESPHTEEYMTYDEISLIRDLGTIQIDDYEYEIDDMKFSIDSYGVHSVNIYIY